ncbi:hypothetical protein [Aestuariimicrobium sp. T2.26MG-19.2B]|uniref:hypothetical protein n=1 Tax=Aestuariimicrobium sp. T2.26MG-19.2B TaxID=3040679 RepID=UPI0024776516|nr:hypothetical protein [Aestuariimicrobium sp. T2.26MG-19.2B]CAI9411567.1 hypothetical protein AESSP_02677 [Aestuariimicrobium sp. T2.26MG-19.2B]
MPRGRRRYFRAPDGVPLKAVPTAATRGGQAWRTPAGAGQLSRLPCWNNAKQWLHNVKAHLETATGETQRAAAKVHSSTVLLVAAHDAGSADARTGRGVATSHRTVAQAIGCSERQVQRARTLLIVMGFCAVVERGRYLTTEERAQAREHHGHRQLRIASERALVNPHRETNVHLPRRGNQSGNLTSRSDSPRRAQTRAGAATTRHQTTQRPSLAVQRLAAALVQRLPWLGRTHIGNVCSALAAANIDPEVTTATDLIEVLDHHNRHRGVPSVPADAQRHPLGLLVHQLRAALPHVPELPRQAAMRQRAEILRERQQRLTAAAIRDSQLEAERADPSLQAKRHARRAGLTAHFRHLDQVNRDRKTKPATPFE